MSHEVKPLGSFPQSEANPDPALADKSLDELQKMVDWPHEFKGIEAEAEEAPEPAPEPSEPEPIDETPTEPVEPEDVAEPVEEPATDTPPEPSAEDIEADILRARFEALEAHSKKMEAKLSGRDAGERGYIKQLQEKIKALESSPRQVAEKDDQGFYEEPERPAPKRQEQAVDPSPAAAWAVQNAVEKAARDFTNGHPDLSELQEGMKQYFQDSKYDSQSILLTNDPFDAARETTRALEEAYWHTKAAARQSKVAELETRRADQVRGLGEAKKKAAISGSGSTPPAPAPRKTVKDLSVSELEKKMAALERR